MRLYRHASEAVVSALQQIFTEKKFGDKALEKVLKNNPRWTARDKQFIAETTYDIVRWYRFFRNASSAKGDDFWTLLAAWCASREMELPRWEEFSAINYTHLRQQVLQNHPTRKINESIPDWLDELGEQELGTQWGHELAALNQEPDVVIRVNTLKTTLPELKEKLEDHDLHSRALKKFPDALILETYTNVFQLPEFKEGLFEVQDAASQAIARFANPQPGSRIIDACAGGGGKTLHLAALIQNKGRIIAMDTEAWKLDELKKRARRAGATTIETRVIDNSKVIKRLEKSADLVLLDVPCSGLGVLRRNPDAKWKLSLPFIELAKAEQEKILMSYSSMVKPGGLLIYATCSILPSENEQQVRKFMKAKTNFELMDENHLWPSDGFDGFYMAALKRLS